MNISIESADLKETEGILGWFHFGTMFCRQMCVRTSIVDVDPSARATVNGTNERLSSRSELRSKNSFEAEFKADLTPPQCLQCSRSFGLTSSQIWQRHGATSSGSCEDPQMGQLRAEAAIYCPHLTQSFPISTAPQTPQTSAPFTFVAPHSTFGQTTSSAAGGVSA